MCIMEINMIQNLVHKAKTSSSLSSSLMMTTTVAAAAAVAAKIKAIVPSEFVIYHATDIF